MVFTNRHESLLNGKSRQHQLAKSFSCDFLSLLIQFSDGLILFLSKKKNKKNDKKNIFCFSTSAFQIVRVIGSPVFVRLSNGFQSTHEYAVTTIRLYVRNSIKSCDCYKYR